MTKQTYFGVTTRQQRYLLFETWEATGKVGEACSKARVVPQTFYNWKARFLEKGYAGLDEPESRAPKNPNRSSAEVEGRVIEMKQQHPEWGKVRIADEMAKEKNWERIVSHNTVKRILVDAGLWITAQTRAKKKPDLR